MKISTVSFYLKVVSILLLLIYLTYINSLRMNHRNEKQDANQDAKQEEEMYFLESPDTLTYFQNKLIQTIIDLEYLLSNKYQADYANEILIGEDVTGNGIFYIPISRSLYQSLQNDCDFQKHKYIVEAIETATPNIFSNDININIEELSKEECVNILSSIRSFVCK